VDVLRSDAVTKRHSASYAVLPGLGSLIPRREEVQKVVAQAVDPLLSILVEPDADSAPAVAWWCGANIAPTHDITTSKLSSAKGSASASASTHSSSTPRSAAIQLRGDGGIVTGRLQRPVLHLERTVEFWFDDAGHPPLPSMVLFSGRSVPAI
jgi:hypothetical protein